MLTTAATVLAHPADIFSLAVTPTQILSASGSSSLRVHSTTESDFPIQQSIDNIHPLGCHHVATSAKGTKAASVGFDGEVKIWAFQEGMWVEDVPAKQNIKSALPEKNGIMMDRSNVALRPLRNRLLTGLPRPGSSTRRGQ